MVVAEWYPNPEPNLNTGVGSRQKARARWKRVVLVKIVIVILGLLTANIIIQALVIRKNCEIAVEQKQIQIISREINKIRVETASLSSYDRIQYLAKTELGMKLATHDDYRRIAAAPVIDRELPQFDQQNIWNKLMTWVGGIGETLANAPQ